MMFTLRFYLASLVLFGIQACNPAFATYLKQDLNYIYSISPYKPATINQGDYKFLINTGLKVTQNFLQKMKAANLIPEEILTQEDLAQLELADEKIDVLIDSLNKWSAKQRIRSRVMPGVPDAIIVYGGGQVSANFKIGGGASITIGLVILPVKVTRVNKYDPNDVKEYVSAHVAPIGWFNPDIGVGIGAAPLAMVGAAFIWGDQMIKPEQFYGGGLSIGKNFVVNRYGIQLTAGAIMNTELPRIIDFYYAGGAFLWAPVGTATPVQANITVGANIILPLGTIIERLSKDFGSEIRLNNRGIQQEIERIFDLELANAQLPQSAAPKGPQKYEDIGPVPMSFDFDKIVE